MGIEWMHVFGYAVSLLIGLSLGMLGGGGSILAVPVLVYLFGVPATMATGDSLLIVGVTALLGAGLAHRDGNVRFRAAGLFALPALAAVYSTRRWVVPAIPESLGFVTRDQGLMMVFAILMFGAASAMIRGRTEPAPRDTGIVAMLVLGASVGTLTALVGAGGGFLIVPALALFAKLPIRHAIGTSLLVIGANSAIGFVGHLQSGFAVDFGFLGPIAALAAIGLGVGTVWSKRVPAERLKPAFGWFVLSMGALILAKELLFTA